MGDYAEVGYEEAVAFAKEISPDANVTFHGNGARWGIFIRTNVSIPPEYPAFYGILSETNALKENLESYEQALKLAKEISPHAYLELDWSGYGWMGHDWIIRYKTPLYSPTTLPLSYKGTPAWEAYHEKSENQSNALMEWAKGKHLQDDPLEYIAENFNITRAEGAEMLAIAEEFHKETNVANLDWDGKITKRQYAKYQANLAKAAKLVDFKPRSALFRKWCNVSRIP